MSSQSANLYESKAVTSTLAGDAAESRRWPMVAATLTCAYFIASALTLPFADDVWVGEAPILALFQAPKSFLKSVVQAGLVALVSAVGLSRGSHSPDYIATHFLAMGVMTTAPALAAVTIMTSLKRMRRRRSLVAAVLLSASLDAIVTFWFEHNFRLSLYNALYF